MEYYSICDDSGAVFLRS